MGKRKKKTTNRVLPAEHVVKAMELMNSGFAVICVRNGSMGNVSRLHLPKLSTSSSTSAQVAVARELGFKVRCWKSKMKHHLNKGEGVELFL